MIVQQNNKPATKTTQKCLPMKTRMGQLHKDSKVEPAGQYVKLDKVPPLTIANINAPIQRAYKWYCRMGCPTRDEMKAKLAKEQAANNNKKYNITEKDIDLLPWNDPERKSWIRKPNKADLKQLQEEGQTTTDEEDNVDTEDDDTDKSSDNDETNNAKNKNKNPNKNDNIQHNTAITGVGVVPQVSRVSETNRVSIKKNFGSAPKGKIQLDLNKPLVSEESSRNSKKVKDYAERRLMQKCKTVGQAANKHRSKTPHIPKPGESLRVDPLGSLKVKSFHMVYKLGDVINEGSYGIVYRGHHVFNKPTDTVAIKVVGKRRGPKDQAVVDETSILRDIRHLPNVTKVIDFYMDTKKMYIVQELARGGDVLDKLIERERYTEADARALAKNLLTTMQSLHELKLVHRDLKPENILIKDSNDDTDIMLCDFGYAAYLPEDGSGLVKRCGTPAYASPEIIKGKEYWEQIDMWSIGCIVFMLLCGQRPFEGEAAELYQNICTAEYHFDVFTWDGISEEAKDLISNLLVLDPKRRFTARQALESDWFVNCTQDQLSSNDISKSLDSIRYYCENIRPVENCQRCWQYDESSYMRTLSNLLQQNPDTTSSLSLEDPLDFFKDKQGAAPTTKTRSSTYIPKPGESLKVNPLGSLKVKSMDMVYLFGDIINEGSFGVVYRAHHVLTPDNIVAAKVVKRKNKAKDQAVIAETLILRDIRHLPNITCVIDFYMDNERIYIVQELARGGDVLDRLIEKKQYTEADARTLAKNLLKIMKSLHDLKLLHRDLKPENILIKDSSDDTDIMLCDFGYASYLPKDGSGLRKRCGTPAYAAPEIINGVEYWAEIDMWSIGCIIFMLLSGQRPFEGTAAEVYEYIRTAEYDFDDPIWDVISDEAKELISNLLILGRTKRFTARQALESEWFVNCSQDELSSNDITRSLDSIRYYCENIRPSENTQRCWQYDATNYMRSRSALLVVEKMSSLSSDDYSVDDCDPLEVPEHVKKAVERDVLGDSDHVIRAAELAKKHFDEAIERGDVESVIQAAELARKKYDEAYDKVEEVLAVMKKKYQQQNIEPDTKQAKEIEEMNQLQQQLRIDRLQKRLSKFKKQKQNKAATTAT